MKKLTTILGFVLIIAFIGFRIYARIKPKILKDAFSKAVLAINKNDFDYDVSQAILSTDLKTTMIYENGKKVIKPSKTYVEFVQKGKVLEIEETIKEVEAINYPDVEFKPIVERTLD